MELNAELQLEELEVLQSIYEDAVQLRADLAGATRSLSVAVGGPHAIRLLVHLPLGYPSLDAPVAEVYESFGLSNAQRDEIIDDLDAIFKRSSGQVCLYEWIEGVRERYASEDYQVAEEEQAQERQDEVDALAQAVDAVSFQSDPQTLRPRVRTAQAVRDPEREKRLLPLIFHGEPLTDRKSTFQAHACPVSSVEDVRSFLAILLDDRKIERAIHNMLAYRIVGDFIVKDNDEDGEDGAGSKMSQLMEMTHAENVAVVVTRWFGGILLGPDRFKHINTVARDALEQGGFIPSSTSTHHGRKKGKK